MKRTERTVKYLDFQMTAYPDSGLAADFDLENILRKAKTLLKNGALHRKPKENASHHIRLRDIRFTKSKGFAILLFTLADKDTVDTTYEDIPSGESRTIPKEKQEGTRFSAHLVIRLGKPKKQAKAVKYLALLEETRGLSPSTMTSSLRSALKKAGRASFKDSDGEEKECFPLVELLGHFSASLDEALKLGNLDGFTLVRNEEQPNGLIDRAALLVDRDYQLRLNVVAKNIPTRLKDIFKQVFQRAEAGKFDTIRVRYTNQDGNQKTHDLTVSQTDALQSLTVRSATIKLDNPMDYDQKSVDFAFAKKMLALAKKEK